MDQKLQEIYQTVIEVGFDDLPPNFLRSFSIETKKNKNIRKILGDYTLFLTPRRICIASKRSITNDLPLSEALSQFFSLKYFKDMVWNTSGIRYIRPVRWLLSISGDKTLECELFGIKSDNKTKPHRIISDEPITVNNVSEYFSLIADNGVIISQKQREREIIEQIRKLNGNNTIDIDKNILEFSVLSVENPLVVFCISPEIFEDVPLKIADFVLREKIMVFPVMSGDRISGFVAVADNPLKTDDVRKVIQKGYEFVAKCRMDDARFYIEVDKKISVSDRIHILEDIVFHKDFGSYYKRTIFISKTADFIIASSKISVDKKKLKRASMLCKTDLTTGLIKEFPELQGYIGMIYCLQAGEDETVSKCVYEHYLPVKQDDPLPQTAEGSVLSVSDKLIQIVAGFLVGLEPTSEGDPYGLRRAARGIIKILISKNIDFSITDYLDYIYNLFSEENIPSISKHEINKVKNKIFNFFLSRLEVYLEEIGFSKNIVDSVLSVTQDPFDAFLRCKALTEISKETLENYLILLKRARNIKEKSIKEKMNIDKDFDEPQLSLSEGVEIDLYNAYLNAKSELAKFYNDKDWTNYIRRVAELRVYVDKFFDGVLILCEDRPKRNSRLFLLDKILTLGTSFCDFTKLIL